MRTRQSLTSLPVSLIGAGRVGTTLAAMLWRRGFRIVSVISRSEKSARRLARSVRCHSYSTNVKDIDNTTALLLFTAPEDVLPSLVESVAQTALRPRYAFHVSGVETSDVLAPMREKGCKIFSLHPIQTFPPWTSRTQQLQKMEGISYGFEGDEEALSFARRLVHLLKGRLLLIPKEKKILYHSACVFASNYSVAIVGVVEKLLSTVSGKISLAHIQPLIEASIAHALTKGPTKALTGPIARGSIQTVQKHIEEIETMLPKYAALYKVLGLAALEIAQQQQKLSHMEKASLKELLNKGNSL